MQSNVPTELIQTKTFKRIVIKIGSNVLTDHEGLRKSFFHHLAGQISFLLDQKIQPVIVSSGAIAAAMSFFHQPKKPTSIPEKQAFAAVGQPILMNLFAKEFQKKGITVAQVLLTQDGMDNRERFINAKHTINQLIHRKIVPIINENDTVSVNEIKIGDNDQLSAHVAHLVEADLLFILSHVDGLYDQDPHQHKEAKLIALVGKIDPKIESMVYDSEDARSVGGMRTKIMAAKICSRYGIPVWITSGLKKNFITKFMRQKAEGTFFLVGKKELSARKHWICSIHRPKGKISIDGGAQKALLDGKKSLLPSGVTRVSGSFHIGDCIEILDETGKLLGKGLSNYSKAEIEKIKGAKSSDIEQILGYKYGDEVVHRDNLVIDR